MKIIPLEKLHQEIDGLIQEGVKNGTGFEDDYESEISIRMIVTETCKKYGIDEDDYWKWKLYNPSPKINPLKQTYSRNELINTLKFFISDTRGDKPWVDADNEWVNQNLK